MLRLQLTAIAAASPPVGAGVAKGDKAAHGEEGRVEIRGGWGTDQINSKQAQAQAQAQARARARARAQAHRHFKGIEGE